MRSGLRNDDVQALVREVRAARDSGLGPDEAWAKAKQAVTDVEPAVFLGWRKHVEQLAEGGTAHTARHDTTDLHQRVVEQEEQIHAMKRQLADKGAQLEAVVKANDEGRQLVSELHVDLGKASDEIEKLRAENEQLKENVKALDEHKKGLEAERNALAEQLDVLSAPPTKKK